jgi:hypothetical protein
MYAREGVIIIFSVAVLFALFTLTRIPWWATVPLCIVLYVFLRLLISPTSSDYTKAAESFEEAEILDQVQGTIERTRRLAESIRKPEVAEIIASICGRGTQITEKLSSEELGSIHIATRILSIMTQTFDILQMYRSIVSGNTKVKSEQDAQQLIARIESQLLPNIDTALSTIAVDLDSGDVTNLKIAMRALDDTLRMHGLIE